jgi:hypothetical protein
MTYKDESAYGTATADIDHDQLFEPMEPILPEATIESVTDAEFLKGHEWGENVYQIVSQDCTIPFSFALNFEQLGLFLWLAMGVVSTSGAPSDYVHIFKPQAGCTSAQLPSCSAILGFLGDTASFLLTKGMCITELRISVDGRGFAMVNGTFQTDGSFTDKAAFTFPTHVVPTYGFGTQSGFASNDAGSGVVSHDAIFHGGEFVINNNLDLADARSVLPDPDLTLGELNFADRTYSLTVRLNAHQGGDFWDDFLAGTAKDLKFDITNTATRYVNVEMFETRITNLVQRFDGIRDIIEVTYTGYYDVTSAAPVVVTVGNSIAVHPEA